MRKKTGSLPTQMMFLFFCLALSSCSVGMALSGEREKDVSILTPGTPQAVVRAAIGPPEDVLIDTGDHGEKLAVDTFKICRGNEPSIGRAIGHGIMDVLTLGIWEAIGTPIEAIGTEEECRLITVYYDEDQKVKEVK